METLKNYLESMFANLPNTEEVQRAKSELWQMMEDKYSELVSEGTSYNEAVGKIISEFGNLDELAEELNIKNVMTKTEDQSERRMVTLEEVKEFLHAAKNRSQQLSVGVMLCILCVIGPIFTDAIYAPDVFGVVFMFVLIIVAVILFVYSSIMMQKWDYLKKEPCSIDFSTTNYLKEEIDRSRSTRAMQLTIGIVLCIASVIPAILLDELNPKIAVGSHAIHVDDLSAIFIIGIVAIGVYLIVLSNNNKAALLSLLNMNDHSTISGTYTKEAGEKEYISDTAETIMSLFWPTITCIYLSWSFLTFAWHITWIIWPVAGIAESVMEKNLTK